MNRDLEAHLKPVVVLGPVALSADNTPDAIDLLGFHAALLLIAVGAGGITFDSSNKIEFKLTHSDDNSSYSAVSADDVILGQNADAVVGTGGIVKSLIAIHASADITAIGYRGSKRYLKVLAGFTGTHGSATPLAVSLVKGHAEVEPV